MLRDACRQTNHFCSTDSFVKGMYQTSLFIIKINSVCMNQPKKCVRNELMALTVDFDDVIFGEMILSSNRHVATFAKCYYFQPTRVGDLAKFIHPPDQTLSSSKQYPSNQPDVEVQPIFMCLRVCLCVYLRNYWPDSVENLHTECKSGPIDCIKVWYRSLNSNPLY